MSGFQYQRLAATLEGAMLGAVALFYRLAAFVALLDNLQLQAAVFADVDLTQFHLVTIRHGAILFVVFGIRGHSPWIGDDDNTKQLPGQHGGAVGAIAG